MTREQNVGSIKVEHAIQEGGKFGGFTKGVVILRNNGGWTGRRRGRWQDKLGFWGRKTSKTIHAVWTRAFARLASDHII